MSKQTSVEWLYQEIINFNGSVSKYNSKKEILEQANKMFQRQMLEFLEDYDSYVFRGGNGSAEEYYNKIFKD